MGTQFTISPSIERTCAVMGEPFARATAFTGRICVAIKDGTMSLAGRASTCAKNAFGGCTFCSRAAGFFKTGFNQAWRVVATHPLTVVTVLALALLGLTAAFLNGASVESQVEEESIAGTGNGEKKINT